MRPPKLRECFVCSFTKYGDKPFQILPLYLLLLSRKIPIIRDKLKSNKDA